MQECTKTNCQGSAGKCKTKKRLLLAASLMFAEKGYFNTSINDICKEAKANISAVNYHFRDKKGLYEAVFTESLSQFQKEIAVVFKKAKDCPPEEVLKEFIGYHLKIALVDEDKVIFNKLRLRHMVDAENIGMADSLQQKIREISKDIHKLIRLIAGEDATDDMVDKLHYTLMAQCLMPGLNPFFKQYIIGVAGDPQKALISFHQHIFNVFMATVKSYGLGK